MSDVNKINNVNNSTTIINSKKVSNGNGTDFSSYLGETESMDDIFDKAADQYNVPVNLLKAIGKAESGFNTNAVSRCGAQGIMQLMPATARSLGVTNSFDAEQNIMGGAKYIAGLLKKYDGNTTLALAAYNAGSGNVAKYGGVPPFDETQNYVKKVTQYMIQAGGVDNTSDSSQTSIAAPINYSGVTFVGRPFQNTSDSNDINTTDNTSDNMTQLKEAFTYDSYLKFLDLFLKDKDNDKNNESEDNTNLNVFKGINNNASVMNMLNTN